MSTVSYLAGRFSMLERTHLSYLIQGTRHALPVYEIRDQENELISTTDASWSGFIRRYGGTWRPTVGALIPIPNGRIRWTVADADDEAHIPLTEVVNYEMMLKGMFGDKPLYTMIGQFPLCPGAL